MEVANVVFTGGTWDLFHIGHLNIIRRSRVLGKKLIVGISTDELILEYKGHLPVVPFDERVEILKELRCVDQIVEMHTLFPLDVYKKWNVDILVSGDDWKHGAHEGIRWMKEHRKMVFLPRTPGVSTSALKQRIRTTLDIKTHL